MGERAAPATGSAWRDITAQARLVGAYCWLDQRLFEITGSCSAGVALAPEMRVWCAATSRRHGALAVSWAARLPVRAGVDRAGLVGEPSRALAGAMDDLATAPEPGSAVVALVTSVLPRLATAYAAHFATASPVNEAPVMELLVRAHREILGEIRTGGRLVEGDPPPENWASVVQSATGLGESFEQAFGATDVLAGGGRS